MNGNVETESERGSTMEILIPLAVLVAWIILQVWVLPRFGVKT
jgi:hypothetical protein